MTQSSQLACPASAPDHGTLSPNDMDVRCQITGLIRDVEGSPCVGHYAGEGGVVCPVWKVEKERVWENKRAHRPEKMINAGSGEWE